MTTTQFPKMDKTAFTTASLFDPSDEKQYWLSKHRQSDWKRLKPCGKIIYGYDPTTTRLRNYFDNVKLPRQKGENVA